MKIVAFLLVFFGILIAMRWWSAHQRRKNDRAAAAPAPTPAPTPDTFVLCVRCDAHTPRANALFAQGEWKCLDPKCGQRSR